MIINRGMYRWVYKFWESVKDQIFPFKVQVLSYLNMLGASEDSSESQVLAMEVLINAKLVHQDFALIIVT